jgi:transposase
VAQVNDLSRSLTAFDPISTLVVVVEMSKSSWLVSGAVPGVERQPLKKLEPDATALLRLIERWRTEAVRAGRPISRITLAYEAGRDGFWLARWLIARGIEAHVIHSASVAVSRERKRAKTDRLDAAMLMRVFLGWLRGERGHCGMVAIPTMEEEDARRPSRERECLVNESLTHHQPHEECTRPSRDPRIQATSAQGARASGRSADSGGHGPAGEHHRGIPARHGTAGIAP